MKRVLKHELFKFFNSLTLKILLLVIAFMAILNSGSIVVMYNLSNLTEMGGNMLAGLFSFSGKGAALQSFADISDLSIYMAAAVALIVVYDITSQTIKNTMISDVSRGKIYIAKYLTEIIAVSILMLANLIIQTGILTVFLGWGETFSFSSFFNNFIVITLMGLLLSFCLTAFINFFAYITKNTVIVIVIAFALTIILSILTYIGMVSDSAIIEFINKISITSVMPNFNASRTFENFLYYILSASLLFFPFFIGGYMYFLRQEIK